MSRLEVVVQEVRGGARQQAHAVVQHLLVEPLEARSDRCQRDELVRVVAEDVGRDHVHQRLQDLEHLRDVVLEGLVRVGVVLRMAPDLLQVLARVLAEQQVIAILHRREGRRHQQRHEPVLRELEVVDDVRPQQREGVREGREPEARMELLGDRGTAHERPALEHEHLEARLREIGAVRQAVVAAADDDGVVRAVRRGRHRQAVLRSGS